MLALPSLDPAIANATYIDLRASVAWLFNDTSDDALACRHNLLASIEELRPATPMEARLAVQVVANDVHALDCLHAVAEHRGSDDKQVRQTRIQANAMQRQSFRALHKLEQMQDARRMRETQKAAIAMLYPPANPALLPALADPGAAPAEAADHLPVGFPPAARAHAPQPGSAPPPLAALPAAPVAEPTATAAESGAAAPTAAPPPARHAGGFSLLALAKAESFAVRKRVVAVRIRRAGRLTPEAIAGFRPEPILNDPAVIEALVYGTSPILRKLDGNGNAAHKAA